MVPINTSYPNSAFPEADKQKMLLFSYQSPIHFGNRRKISIFYKDQAVFSEITEAGHRYHLSVRGYPQTLVAFPVRLKQFFASTYLTAEKKITGDYSYVRATPSLKGGGGSGQQDILPMYPGYAIGNVIRKEALMIPLLEKQRNSLLNEFDKAVKKQDAIKILYKDEPKEKRTEKVMDCEVEISFINKKIQGVQKKLYALLQTDNVETSLFEETLPIDTARSKSKIEEGRSFPSEQMAHQIFKNTTTGRELEEVVNKFFSRLFSEDTPSRFLPSSTLEGIVQGIGDMLKTDSCISLVGSFVTLSRVRVMDPVVIRNKAIISEQLTNGSENYFVLTEAVLGAVFLGFGKSVSLEILPEEKAEKVDPSLMSRLSMISFISQGAIPKISRDAHDVNLWNVYTSWKEILQKDQNSGYPIGFKVRKLQDILVENKILPTQ